MKLYTESGQEINLDEDVIGKLSDWFIRSAPYQLKEFSFVQRVIWLNEEIVRFKNIEQQEIEIAAAKMEEDYFKKAQEGGEYGESSYHTA